VHAHGSLVALQCTGVPGGGVYMGGGGTWMWCGEVGNIHEAAVMLDSAAALALDPAAAFGAGGGGAGNGGVAKSLWPRAGAGYTAPVDG
jgi:hypothetical protein